MLLKLLKLNASDAIISGATAISSSGSVTLRNTCHAPPPSTRAASYSSLGTDCNAPIETRKKEGKVSQRLTRMTETLAQFASKRQGTSRWNAWLTTPNLSFSRPDHTRIERSPGMAYGITSTDR